MSNNRRAAPHGTIIKATLDTRRFSFEAYGESEQQALAALRAALQRHAKEYNADPGWVRDLLSHEAGNVWFMPITIGAAYRDGAQLHPKEQ